MLKKERKIELEKYNEEIREKLNGEYTDLYDENRNLTGEKVFREKGQKSITGGHVKSGQNSLEAIQEEIEEELGLKIDEKEIKLFKTYKYENAFKDVYYVKKDIDISNLKLQLDEVECVEYFSKEEILKFIKNDELRKTNIDAFMDFINE